MAKEKNNKNNFRCMCCGKEYETKPSICENCYNGDPDKWEKILPPIKEEDPKGKIKKVLPAFVALLLVMIVVAVWSGKSGNPEAVPTTDQLPQTSEAGSTAVIDEDITASPAATEEYNTTMTDSVDLEEPGLLG